MKKFFIYLHRYIGLIAGLTIFISCFSGAVLSFQNEIRELTYADLYRRPQSEHKSVLPLGELITRVNAQLSEGQIESVQIPSDTTYNYVFTPSSPERTQLYINPYNGNIVGKIDKDTSDIFGFFFRVHRWLLDDSKTWGKARESSKPASRSRQEQAVYAFGETFMPQEGYMQLLAFSSWLSLV